MKYNNYLQSKKWKKRRQLSLENNNGVCAFCFTDKNLHIHHKSYKNRVDKSVLGREPGKYLVPLCASCHRKWHFYHGKRFLRKQMIRRANAMFLEGMSLDDCIRFCFNKYIYKHAIINWKKDRDKESRNEADNNAIKAAGGNIKLIKGYITENDKKIY